MPANPVAAVRAPKRAKTLPKALSVDDASALMDAPLANTTEGIRDHAILELFYSSGLRLAELIGLDVMYTQADGYRSTGWLDLAEAEVTVRGKGNKERKVPVGRKAIDALNAWLAVRGEFVKHDPHPLFVSVRGNRMSPGVVRERVKRAALTAGIPANVHPHVLRHSFATHVLQSSGDLRAVQELLGHASVSATQVYTSLDFQHLAKIYDSAHPRAKKRLTRVPCYRRARRPATAGFAHGPFRSHHANRHPQAVQGKIAAAPPSVDLRQCDRPRRRQARARRDRDRARARRPLPRARRVQPAIADPRARVELRRERADRPRVLQAPRAARSRTARRWCRARVRCGSCSAKPTGCRG